MRVIARMLGVPEETAPRLLAWSHRMVAMYAFGRTRAVEGGRQRRRAGLFFFSAFVRETVAARRGRPGDDLLSVLIAAEEKGERLTEDELVSTAILLLNAGHEATVHATGNAVRTILETGADPAVLFADDGTTETTVEECCASIRRCTSSRVMRSRTWRRAEFLYGRATRSASCSAPPAATPG